MLVLGSLPGEASLAAGQYYAHPRNRFWHLIGGVIGHIDLPALPYAQRLDTLLSAGVGLWDTIISARRRGSLDSAIRDATTAPLAELVATLPALRCVAFNGARSASAGRPQLAASGLALIDLPSSSPANAAMTLAKKQEQWRILEQFLC